MIRCRYSKACPACGRREHAKILPCRWRLECSRKKQADSPEVLETLEAFQTHHCFPSVRPERADEREHAHLPKQWPWVAFRITWANGVECDFRFIKINSNQFENSKEQFHRFILKKLLSFSSQSSRESLATLSRESRESLESSTSSLETLARESRDFSAMISKLSKNIWRLEPHTKGFAVAIVLHD
jgi:hypothetical protein